MTTKKCKVIWKNDLVAVVDFGGVQVQVPSKMLKGEEITLKKDGGSYYIIGEDEVVPRDKDNA